MMGMFGKRITTDDCRSSGLSLEAILPTDGARLPQEALRLASLTDLYFSVVRAVEEARQGNQAGETAKNMIYREMSRREGEVLDLIGALAGRDLSTDSVDDLFREYRRCYRLSWHDSKATDEEWCRLYSEVASRMNRLRVLQRAISNRPSTKHETEEE